ncbi:MAG: 2-oxoacid:acceptor oxidoreductase family protein [Candidatus Pacearchaeota archaeon]|jgi:2-oxoacid:acceptor oxidoreductase gamma subunit (pyruvate/2-ketoisovalerate family)
MVKATKKETKNKKSEELIEIRIHGRGGQGAVTTAQLLAIAAFYEGKYVQAFPFFGIEREGSPSTSFVRISTKPINERQQIYNPDYAIIFDPSLIKLVNASKGVKKTMIINTSQKIKGCCTEDVTSRAIKIFGKPIVNTLILGAFAAFTNIVKLESLERAIEDKFKNKPALIEQNKRAVRETYEEVKNNKGKNLR